MPGALAISGSNLAGTGAFSAALRTDRGLAQVAPAGRADLAVLVRELCRETGVTLRDVDEVRVDRGPGSYVGLRVAVTFARFVAAFAGARLAAADSLQLIALRALAAAGDSALQTALQTARLCPVVDGRGGRVHAAAFRSQGDGALATAAPAAAVEVAEFAAWSRPGDVFLTPGKLPAGLEFPAGATVREVTAPTAADLFDDRIALDEVAPTALEPLYLMGSYVS